MVRVELISVIVEAAAIVGIKLICVIVGVHSLLLLIRKRYTGMRVIKKN